MKKSKLIRNLEVETLNKLRLLAAKSGMNLSEYIRYILDEAAKDN